MKGAVGKDGSAQTESRKDFLAAVLKRLGDWFVEIVPTPGVRRVDLFTRDTAHPRLRAL